MKKSKLKNSFHVSNYKIEINENKNDPEIIKNAKSVVELLKKQNKLFRFEMMNFHISNKMNERIRAKLKTIKSAIKT